MKADPLLKIESDEYEVECPTCKGRGQYEYMDYQAGHPDMMECHCNTGTSTVKLVGMVEVTQNYHDSCGCYLEILNEDGTQLYGGYKEQVVHQLTEAYRNNTLPDEIRDCLKEVPA